MQSRVQDWWLSWCWWVSDDCFAEMIPVLEQGLGRLAVRLVYRKVCTDSPSTAILLRQLPRHWTAGQPTHSRYLHNPGKSCSSKPVTSNKPSAGHLQLAHYQRGKIFDLVRTELRHGGWGYSWMGTGWYFTWSETGHSDLSAWWGRRGAEHARTVSMKSISMEI